MDSDGVDVAHSGAHTTKSPAATVPVSVIDVPLAAVRLVGLMAVMTLASVVAFFSGIGAAVVVTGA